MFPEFLSYTCKIYERLYSVQVCINTCVGAYQQLIGHCTDEELMDIVMPRVAPAVSVWEFIVLRAAKGYTVRPEWTELIRQLAELQEEVRDVVKDRFISTDPSEVTARTSGEDTIEVCTFTSSLFSQHPLLFKLLSQLILFK